MDEQLSSSSIFEHVDRLSRGSSDGTRRVSNKIQLIAMQPMPSPPSYPHNQALSPNLTDKMPDGAKVNSEVSKQAHTLHKHRYSIHMMFNLYNVTYFPKFSSVNYI